MISTASDLVMAPEDVEKLDARLVEARATHQRAVAVAEEFDCFIELAERESDNTLRAALNGAREIFRRNVGRADQLVRSLEVFRAASPDVAKLALLPNTPGAFFIILGARMVLALGRPPSENEQAADIIATLHRIIRDPAMPDLRISYARDLLHETDGMLDLALAEARRLRAPVGRRSRGKTKKELA
jgi:hypothetical protein